MNEKGPIVIIDDNEITAASIGETVAGLRFPNQVVIINDTVNVTKKLKEMGEPYLVLSKLADATDGFDIRKAILADTTLYQGSLPYLFYSVAGSDDIREKVTEQEVNGYFNDITDYNELGYALDNLLTHYEMEAKTIN